MANHPFEITRHDLTFPGLNLPAPGITIIHLTDFHAGNPETESVLLSAVEWTTRQAPDYLVMTGDYIDTHERQVDDAVRILSGLRARSGIYATIGNHDYRSRHRPVDRALCQMGIRVLDNEAEQLNCGLWIAGVDDLNEGGGKVHEALDAIPEDSGVILLSHNPNAVDDIPDRRSVTVLAGHTHGGQIVLTFPNPKLVCRWKLRTKYPAGWYQRGNLRLYVNRGLGVTGRPPFNRRYRCEPEVAVFRIRSV